MAYFEYKATKLYYETYGKNQPVLLIHGWGIDHNYFIGCMEPMFEEMPDIFQRYYIDLPGMGKSTEGFIHKGDDVVEILSEFIKQVISSESVLLVGNSFGGLISCGIARQIPELIQGMILVAPSTGCDKRNLPEKRIWKKDNTFLEKLTPIQKEDYCELNVTLSQESWKRYEQYIYPAVLNSKNNEFLNHVLDGSLSCNLYQVEGAKHFMKPVLFLVGKQDSSVGYEDQFQLAKLYPESTYVALHGAGHNVWIDQPEFFHQIVSSWIKSNFLII